MRRFDESNAECVVLTYREGLLSPLGHEDNIVRHVLDATRHPEIRFVSRSVEEQKDLILVDGTLAIRGRERRLIVPLRKKACGWVAEIRVHQPDFGIPPFRALLGALRVKADVTVRLSLPAA
jgi:polyisoprenoid-binding protein YceI